MKCQNGDCEHEASIALRDGRNVCPACSLLLDDRPGRGVKAEYHELNPDMPTDARQAIGLPSRQPYVRRRRRLTIEAQCLRLLATDSHSVATTL